MNKKYTILSLMFVFLFCAGLSQGQPDNNTSTIEDDAITAEIPVPLASEAALQDESAEVNETADANATQVNLGPNLNYIWSFSGIEAGPITMALNQEGIELYGQAKYEPDGGKPWNANVDGSVTGNEVELTMTAQKDNELITTKMIGTYANDTINGNFTQISGGKKVGSGTFSAMWINPDTSSYTPAVIEEPKVETPAPAVVDTPADSNASGKETAETEKASRFVDIHEYADKIQTGVGDISGIPI
ncbi:MAG: hypothetical protein JW999_10730 [Methanotrichaceae archaeon]|nr:hypothetical protein [Methanotrichaceae archaeon]